MWKGCERTVFGCLFSGLCFACLGHEACCRSRLSEASHRGILLGVGSNPAAVRAFRMGSFTAPWHVCGRFGLGTTFGSSTAFGVAVYWFRTQPRSEGAGHKKCFMDSKGDGKHFFWLVFLACLSSACTQIFQSTLVLFDPCLIMVFFFKKIEVFFLKNKGIFFVYMALSFCQHIVIFWIFHVLFSWIVKLVRKIHNSIIQLNLLNPI